ncbi:MAG: calcium/sodium antiporter [Woeseiaceae bacterium]
MMAFLGVVLGVVALIGGGVLLVRGASDLATKLGVSPMIVGLTIVSFGTSAPELVVNVMGAIRGETALAFGNVVGSNISNLSLILGITAIVAPITIQGGLVRREVPLLLLGTTMLTVMALDGLLEGYPPALGLSDSIVLLLVFCIFLYITAMDVLRPSHRDQLFVDIEESRIVHDGVKPTQAVLFMLGGGTLLFVGGELTVTNATTLAARFDVSPTIVGLFVVAIGTSLPELVTSVVAALKKESDLALGNVIGSNLFNTLFVLPSSGLISKIAIPEGGVADLAMSWLFAAILIPLFYIGSGRLGRMSGFLLLLVYGGYAFFRIQGQTT